MNLSLNLNIHFSTQQNITIEKRVEDNEEKIHSLYYENAFKLGRMGEKLLEESTDSTSSNSIEKRVQNNEKRIFFKKLECIFNLGKNYTLLKNRKALCEKKHFYFTKKLEELQIVQAEQWKMVIQRADIATHTATKLVDSLTQELDFTLKEVEEVSRKVVFDRYLHWLKQRPPICTLDDSFKQHPFYSNQTQPPIPLSPKLFLVSDQNKIFAHKYLEKTQKLETKILQKRKYNKILKNSIKHRKEKHTSLMKSLKICVFIFGFERHLKFLNALQVFVCSDRQSYEKKIPNTFEALTKKSYEEFVKEMAFVEERLLSVISKTEELAKEFQNTLKEYQNTLENK